MTMARPHLADISITRWHHCITRRVRRAFLLAEGPPARKVWINHRLKELAESSRFQSVASRYSIIFSKKLSDGRLFGRFLSAKAALGFLNTDWWSGVADSNASWSAPPFRK
jgi:hypothetical protein